MCNILLAYFILTIIIRITYLYYILLYIIPLPIYYIYYIILFRFCQVKNEGKVKIIIRGLKGGIKLIGYMLYFYGCRTPSLLFSIGTSPRVSPEKHSFFLTPASYYALGRAPNLAGFLSIRLHPLQRSTHHVPSELYRYCRRALHRSHPDQQRLRYHSVLGGRFPLQRGVQGGGHHTDGEPPSYHTTGIRAHAGLLPGPE